ncbi:MAG: GTPase Era [Flammeovirgaceae bacterium]|nr:GTPase Era [Flammeovirgaceae bacterium]
MDQAPKKEHKAGFVSIIGRPNVGKSTLMNKLVGENLSIITAKAQTTRHRIMGILNGEDFQIIYSDTPGLLTPKYELHKAMMSFVKVSLEDADLVLLVVEVGEKLNPLIEEVIRKIDAPTLVIINKIDKSKKEEIDECISYWTSELKSERVIAVSALKGTKINEVFSLIKTYLPVHPEYFPKDEMTTRSERFFASEIIREKIFMNYEQEIPYSTEVGIESFKEEDQIIRIRAILFVERDSQKGILIGKGGSSLKKTGTEARKDLEAFFGKKIFLETFVKVADNWRKQRNKLAQFGYLES